jgi:S1-C subfamily serine protease
MQRHFSVFAALLMILAFAPDASSDPKEPETSSNPTSDVHPGYEISEQRLSLTKWNIDQAASAQMEAVNSGPFRIGIPQYILDYASSHDNHERVEASSSLKVRFKGVEDSTNIAEGVLKSSGRETFDPASEASLLGYRENIIDAINRPALFLCKNTIMDDVPPLWASRINNDEFSTHLRAITDSVGLISVQWGAADPEPVGTGFVAAQGVLITNRHVAEAFADDTGAFLKDGNISAHATINFCDERCQRPDKIFDIKQVLYVVPAPGPDVALLELDAPAGSTVPSPLPLEVAQPPVDTALPASISGDDDNPTARHVGEFVYTIGFPFHDKRAPEDVEFDVFGSPLGVKRIALGQLQAVSGLGKHQLMAYDCSTLGGCSGSPVFDLKSGKVWGVHFSGAFKQSNYAWALWEVCKEDQRVASLIKP